MIFEDKVQFVNALLFGGEAFVLGFHTESFVMFAVMVQGKKITRALNTKGTLFLHQKEHVCLGLSLDFARILTKLQLKNDF